MRARVRSSGLSRTQRRALRVSRVLYACFGIVLGILVIGVVALSPEASDKPVVTVHGPVDCRDCEQWIEYLNRRGFRAVSGSAGRGEELRRGLRLPAGFRNSVVATVDGFMICGFVPAHEIHQLVRGELGNKIIGVAVRDGSLPPWKPVAMASRGLTVFVLLPGGVLRPVRVYHGLVMDNEGATDVRRAFST